MDRPPQDSVPAGAPPVLEPAAFEGLTDAELVSRFAALEGAASEEAFAALVRRHGPMVLRTCRGMLRDGHAAHDAFQATFLVLMRSAPALRVRDTISPWLHEVAYRVSCAARSAEARRARHERRAAEMAERQVTDRDPDDAAPLLHDEISRLPERYRRPVILCYLEGLTSEQAAARLGMPVGTVRSRLARGRERLRGRLVRRGVVLSAALLGASLASGGAPAPLPSGLAEATARAVMLAATGGAIPASVLALIRRGVRRPGLTPRKITAGVLALSAVAAALGVWSTVVKRPAPARPRAMLSRAVERPAASATEPAPVWNVALSPDGRRLLAGAQGVGGRPAELILWDLASRRELFRVTEPRASRSVAFSPDGKLIATGGFGTVARLFDAATGRVLRPLRGHSSGINAVVFSPDGKTLATGSWDKTVKLWDVATGEARATLTGHTAQVFGVAYSPDGKAVASCGCDGTARVWDASSGAETAVLTGHQGVVETLAYSPDGKTLATAGWDGTLRLWDAATGRELAKLEGPRDQLGVAFSPDGKTLASLSAPGDGPPGALTSVLTFWDVAARKLLATVPAHADRSYSVVFSPDGKTLVTSSMDRTIKLWDVATRQAKGTLSTAPAPGGSWDPHGRWDDD
jgi:RNA polymerase sigma factor (sigma-70 family)